MRLVPLSCFRRESLESKLCSPAVASHSHKRSLLIAVNPHPLLIHAFEGSSREPSTFLGQAWLRVLSLAFPEVVAYGSSPLGHHPTDTFQNYFSSWPLLEPQSSPRITSLGWTLLFVFNPSHTTYLPPFTVLNCGAIFTFCEEPSFRQWCVGECVLSRSLEGGFWSVVLAHFYGTGTSSKG